MAQGHDQAEAARRDGGEINAHSRIEPSFSQPIRDNVLESISQIDGQIVIKVSATTSSSCAIFRSWC